MTARSERESTAKSMDSHEAKTSSKDVKSVNRQHVSHHYMFSKDWSLHVCIKEVHSSFVCSLLCTCEGAHMFVIVKDGYVVWMCCRGDQRPRAHLCTNTHLCNYVSVPQLALAPLLLKTQKYNVKTLRGKTGDTVWQMYFFTSYFHNVSEKICFSFPQMRSARFGTGNPGEPCFHFTVCRRVGSPTQAVTSNLFRKAFNDKKKRVNACWRYTRILRQ